MLLRIRIHVNLFLVGYSSFSIWNAHFVFGVHHPIFTDAVLILLETNVYAVQPKISTCCDHEKMTVAPAPHLMFFCVTVVPCIRLKCDRMTEVDLMDKRYLAQFDCNSCISMYSSICNDLILSCVHITVAGPYAHQATKADFQ